ncbi:MAG TPA: PIG-L family deacetylase [Thermoanaerobaculia bacterium]|jgi:LmbE family N-acetylglucosaminyl deacetylase|nr:PIG-L family deacetylase [Thermoanaerobaculia bacterium]
MDTLFVFAHQDDEIAFASRIRLCIARGDRVRCVYLTDGASRVAASVRNNESRRALATLGVTEVEFASVAADGALPDHLEDALAALTPADEIYTLAWEGGHQDHDAAFVVAAAFADRHGIPCTELPLYNGDHTIGPLFRVNHPIGKGWTSRPITQREKLANVLLTRFYRSQRSTWLALAPLMLLAPAVEFTRAADLRRVSRPPHQGRLFYERRFRYPYSRFAERAEAFLRRQSRRG